MQLLCERHIPTSYKTALRNESWNSVVDCGDIFAPGTDDATIANYAEQNGYVIFTRDAPFFNDIKADVYNCGGLFLHMRHRHQASDIVDAIKDISTAYGDHRRIAENVHDWI